MSEHIALLGDSIFDNASYTNGQPDVVTHLRQVLPDGCSASLLAVDGSTTNDLGDQIARLPEDISHVVVSVGGNDAILNADILNLPVASNRETFNLLGQRGATFEDSYRTAIVGVTKRVARVTVCTVYNGNLPEAEARPARVALMIFNDAILRVAFQLRLGVIDLRLICDEPSDYANPIEPSGTGGAKIARAIATSLGLLKHDSPTSHVYAG